MAFRKKVKNNYVPPFNIGGFSEPKMVSSETGRGIKSVSLKSVSVPDVAKTSLPLMSLDSVRQSGKVIDGNVSFAPSDPTVIEDVQSYLGDVVERVSVNGVKPVEAPPVETPPVETSVSE